MIAKGVFNQPEPGISLHDRTPHCVAIFEVVMVALDKIYLLFFCDVNIYFCVINEGALE